MDVIRIFLLSLIFYFVSTEEILFESGISLSTVQQSTLSNPSEYNDLENTDSYIFDAGVNNNEKKRLSLNVLIEHFKSPSSRYFRAHPDFITCVYRVFKDLHKQGKGLMVHDGYKTKTDSNNKDDIQTRYSRSGTGITLGFKPGVNGDVKDIAAAALKNCPVFFERLQRNLGIVLLAGNVVHLHMTGTQNAAPYFGMDGYSGMTESELRSWALNQIDAGIDPIGIPNCDKILRLDSGQSHPSDITTAPEAVGDIDIPIDRDSEYDFSTLVQYQGRNIEFENNERFAAWCGKPGTPCINCKVSPLGNSLNQRCAARLMSQRMYTVLNTLQKLVRANNEKLKVSKSWDEKYTGHVDDYDETSLHTEGRLVAVTLSSGSTPASTKKLSQWAICSKADFVQNNGDHIIIGVKKMFGTLPQKINFPHVEMLRVESPHVSRGLYELPSGFDSDDEAKYPLLDSSHQTDLTLADNTDLSVFLSKDPNARYFRLHPLIAECYSLLVYNLNKHNAAGDPMIQLEVIRGFLSTREQALLDQSDKRFNTMILGTGFEVKYSSQNSEVRPLHSLVKVAVDHCGPLFHEIVQQEIGIGLYPDRMFVNIRTNFDLWTRVPEQLPKGYTLVEYREEMLNRFELAVDNRIVDPDDMSEACLAANHPGLQSPAFKHQHPEHVLRRRRAAPEPDDCVPVSDTEFCRSTVHERQKHVDKIWTEVSRKWMYHSPNETKEALIGCFMTCGTCLSGEIYEEKTAYCNDFIHWAPYDMMNEASGITNIFPRDVMELRERACKKGHCIEDSPLFHLVANSAAASYRPDSTKSVEYELFPQVENPSPLFELLSRIYAITASGTVKFWVRNELDMLSLMSPLEVAMLYNKNVTDVEVFVKETSKIDAVEGVIQTAVAEWANSGCPRHTRETIAPSKVISLPLDVGKRSPHLAIREDIIHHYTNWESRWANMEL